MSLERNENLPFVSVIVPVYNGEKIISSCIEALLIQKYPQDRFETIIVDNNSTDDTKKVINQYPVKYLLQDEYQSSYASRNSGIKEAKGDLLAFTDADCIPERNWLPELVRAMEDQSLGGAGGMIKAYRPVTLIEQYAASAVLDQEKTLRHPIHPFIQTANAVYRREVFVRIGNFDNTLVSWGDVDMSWRVQKETDWKLAYVPEAVVEHRHRTTVPGLYRQARRYGFGQATAAARFPDELKVTADTFVSKRLKKLGMCGLSLISRSLKQLIGKSDSLYTLQPAFYAVELAGELAGWRRYRRSKKLKPD